jgi:DNA gyrase subunit B
LRELSYLNRRISITLNDLREKDEEGNSIPKNFYSEGGIVEFVEMLDKNGNRNPSSPPPYM